MKTKSILRIFLLLSLFGLGLILLLGQEHCDSTAAWLTLAVIDKSLGLLSLFAAVGLYRRWRYSDPLLSAYERWCNRVDSARL